MLFAEIRRIVGVPMAVFTYRYELRRGEEVISTGHLTQERALEVGERIEIGGVLGIVRAVEPVLGEREFRSSCSSGARESPPRRVRPGDRWGARIRRRLKVLEPRDLQLKRGLRSHRFRGGEREAVSPPIAP